mgnify:CR=1 FL=1
MKKFDKNNSVKFQVVHRSLQDSRYYDDTASKSVLVPIQQKNSNNSNSKKTSKKFQREENVDLNTLENELKNKNEGKAASYGVLFDDSEYDYMQHLKDIGTSGGIFISKKEAAEKQKENQKKSLSKLFGDDMLPSEEIKSYNYQTQQDIPDEISGFKPDLNPDLREALIALEDENYLDDEQDIDDIDVFDELLNGKKQNEISLNEYDDNAYDDGDWDYDDYDDYEGGGDVEEGGETNWEKDFAKYKKQRKVDEFDSDNEFDSDEEEEEEEYDEDEDTFGELPDIQGKKLKSSNTKASKKKAKRKKGATTDTSSYSMSSSALCRTEQMTIIDDKFDVLREQYDNNNESEEDDYQPFDLSKERDDFMDLVDDFLDNYQLEKRGKRVVKKNEEMERYRVAAMSVTKDNSRVKNRNLRKDSSLVDKLDNMKI